MVDCVPEVLYSFGGGSLCEDGVGLIVEGGSHGTGVDVELFEVFYFDLIVFVYLRCRVHTLISLYLSLPFSYLQ